MNIHTIVEKILRNRGITNFTHFLNPSLRDLSDPQNIVPLSAGRLVAKAIKDNKRICIYGDYDVDGVCSTALLANFFRELGFYNYTTLIPSRYEDGYGLSMNLAQQMVEDKVDLVITVDCGITSIDEVKYLKDNNVKVIVTDHHTPKEELPNADFIANPKVSPERENEADYHICGCGVAFKLIQTIRRVLNRKDINLKKYLDLVGLATVADIVPLIGENRVLVKHGLQVINSNPSPGLQALIEVAGLKDKEIKSYHHGFVLGPRINASGRIDVADTALKLLTSNDPVVTLKLAENLDNINRERQDLCEKTAVEAEKMIDDYGFADNKVIVLYQPHWIKGIIGIVASRILEKYYRPVILFGGDEPITTGSARSIDGIDMFGLLTEVDKKKHGLLEKFGGHKKAAGLSVSRENIDIFREKINEIAESSYPENLFVRKNTYDLAVTVDDLDIELAKDLELLEPFGEDNRRPVFRIKNAKIESRRAVGANGNHLMLDLSNGNGKKVRGIWFNYNGNNIDPANLFGYIDCNRYNGGEYCQVKVVEKNYELS